MKNTSGFTKRLNEYNLRLQRKIKRNNKDIINFTKRLNEDNLYCQKQIEENTLKIDFYKKIKNINLPEDHSLVFVKEKAFIYLKYDDFLKTFSCEKIYLDNKNISLYKGINFLKKIKIDGCSKIIIFYSQFIPAEYDELGNISCIPEINFSFLSEKQNKRIKNNIIKDIPGYKFKAKDFKIEDKYIKKMITLQ